MEIAVDMYSNILKGEEYSFIKTNEHLGKHVILLGLAGSFSYGTNIETSDIDLRGIALNSKSDLIGLTQFEQYVDENTDSVIYGFIRRYRYGRDLFCYCRNQSSLRTGFH